MTTTYDADLRDAPGRETATPATVNHYHADDRPDYLVGRSWPAACDIELRALIVSNVTIRVRRVAGGRIEISGLGAAFHMHRGHPMALAIGLADWLDEYNQVPGDAAFAQLREELLAHA